tara:strand:- start:142 stop:318 length:177 start_codon:yes stop_codon:yes gene_type:complete
MLNEGNKKVRKAIIIPKEVREKLLILKGSSSSLSKSLSAEQREESSFDLLFVKSFDFV